MKKIYLVMESVELSKNDIESVVLEAHLSATSATNACTEYKQKGMECWIKTVNCVVDNSMQQKLNLV